MSTPRLFALFGHPVGHSLSSVVHGAAFEALGLPHRYELRDLPDAASLGRAVDEVRAGSIAGANVTMPHKEAALALADQVQDDVTRIGAANVLVRSDAGLVVAHNTDVGAVAAEVAGHTSARGSALVLGAGGAARAAVVALASLGFRDIGCMARRAEAARSLEPLGARAIVWRQSGEADVRPAHDAPIDVVVNATSAGTGGRAQDDLIAAIPWNALGPRAFVLDLVYRPIETVLTSHARSVGLVAEAGLGVLVAQAEATFALWLGVASPPGVMMRAARAALGG